VEVKSLINILYLSIFPASIFQLCFHLETITTEIFHPYKALRSLQTIFHPPLHLPFGFNKIFHNSLDAFAIDTCWWHLFPLSVSVFGSISFAPSLLLCSQTRRWKFTPAGGRRCTTVSSVVRCRCPQDLRLASSTMPGADDGPVGLGALKKTFLGPGMYNFWRCCNVQNGTNIY